MTTLLPNAVQQFLDRNGVPLAGGSVTFYIPGTTTFKTTWMDSSQISANTNPVILDSAGEAVIYGLGAYRSILKDALGNQIWDQVTSSTDAGGIFSGGTSTGTAANQIVATTTPAGFSLTAGNQLTFVAGFSSTGATTLNANGTGAKNILKPGATGPIALAAGDIGVGDAVVVYYDGTQFQIINPIALPLSGGTLSGALNEAKAASAATATGGVLDISAVAANQIDMTAAAGSFSSFGTLPAGARRTLRFTNATPGTLLAGGSILVPGGASIVVAQNDILDIRSLGSGNWELVSYTRASGGATKTQMQAATDPFSPVTPSVANQADGAAKAHGVITGNALTAGFNIASVAHSSAGVYAFAFVTSLSSGNFSVVVSPGSIGRVVYADLSTRSATGFTIKAVGSDFSTPADADFSLAVFGRQ